MNDIPAISPQDVAVQILIWLGVPALVLAPFVIASSVVGWFRAAVATEAAARVAGQRINAWWSQLRMLRVVVLIASGALCTATSYGTVQLWFFISRSGDASGFPLAIGPSTSWPELMEALATYHDPAESTRVVGLVVLGWVLALNVAGAFALQDVFRVLAVLWWPICGLAWVVGGIMAVLGGLVAILAANGDTDVGGQTWTGFLTTAVVLALLGFSGMWTSALVMKVFPAVTPDGW